MSEKGKYGGTRDWALWVEDGGALRLLGAGYLYATEENAHAGLARAVKRGELATNSKGEPCTRFMWRRVMVRPVPR